MKKIVILGATGSIGRNTIDVIRQHPETFQIEALVANTNVVDMLALCLENKPKFAVLNDEQAAQHLAQALRSHQSTTEVFSGMAAIERMVSLPQVDFVMAAIVGACGMRSTLAAARAGKRILLANKEALIMAGELLMSAVKENQASIIPVDSEHNAIFQCMPAGYVCGETPSGVDHVILTASGGPFRQTPLAELADKTPEQACAHPNWQMGRKISIDSATMMNKALEVIEAHFLFNLPAEKIKVVLHPQSVIHSLVSYQDNSVLAQLGNPDMRVPIASSLSWPARITNNVTPLDLISCGRLDFEPLSEQRFPAIKLVYQMLAKGGSALIAFNAANEVAVAAFLAMRIKFTDIVEIVIKVTDQLPVIAINTLDDITTIDAQARQLSETLVSQIANGVAS